MPGHIEGNDAMAHGDARIVHQRPVLAPVGAGGVQAEERRPLTRLLHVDTMWPPEQIELHVAANDRLEARHHADAPAGRSFASASLK